MVVMRGSRSLRSSNRLVAAVIATAVVAASAATASNADAAATTPRRLEDYVEEYKYEDLSQFSLHFDKCQDIRMYDDEIAEEGIEPFAFRSFVAFRICPSSSCTECDENYGRYVLDVETYLAYTVENRQEMFEEMCQNCGNNNNNNGNNNGACSDECYEYQNMEDMGYVDASQFVQCERLKVEQQDDDNAQDDGQQEQVEYYIGPRCADGNQGGRIVSIGLFSDENCYQPVYDVDMEELLGYKLSYILLSHSLDSSNACLSCNENDFNNANDRQDADQVNEMCEEIYDAAAKCETPTGIEWGFMRENEEQGQYQNQAAAEFYACNFINSIYWDSYDNRGEINYKSKQDVYIRHVTKTQKIALVALSVVIVGMALGIRYLNDKIADITGVNGLAQGTFA